MRIRAALLAAPLCALLFSCGSPIQSRLSLDPEAKKGWTVLFYADADNSLDYEIMLDMAEIKAGLSSDADINVILLVDRASDASTTTAFGEVFSDTRLYRLLDGAFVRLDGGSELPSITKTSSWEGNMGDATTLKSFVDYGKARYPASHYALLLSNHGGGAKGSGSNSGIVSKNICVDESSVDTSGSYDILYSAEITDVLGSAESVDLLVFDACLMGTAEVAYQYRPKSNGFGADYLAASAPNVWGYGLPYTAILQRLQPLPGNNGTADTTLTAYNSGTATNEPYYDPATMSAGDFGEAIVEEQRDSTLAGGGTEQSFCLFDLSKIAAVKAAVDAVAKQLGTSALKTAMETARSSTISYMGGTSGSYWVSSPYFDLYSLATKAKGAPLVVTALGVATPLSTLETAVDDCVVYSFGKDFTGFTANQNGLSIFFPDGDGKNYDSSRIDWAYQWWYSPIDTSTLTFSDSLPHLYGKLDWCIYASDSSTVRSANTTVQNWFELLDYWYDTLNSSNYNDVSY